jgi:hypothetical protein
MHITTSQSKSFIRLTTKSTLIMMSFEHDQGNKPPRVQLYSSTCMAEKLVQGESMADDWQADVHFFHPKLSSPPSVKFNLEKTIIYQ